MSCVLVTLEFTPLFFFAEYRLKAFISHSGNSTNCGHYVCHIFKVCGPLCTLTHSHSLFHSCL